MHSAPAPSFLHKCLQAFVGMLWPLFLLPITCWAGEQLRVQVVLSGDAPPYQEFAISLQQQLPKNIELSLLQHPEAFSDSGPRADIVVTVGQRAAEWVAPKTTSPVLAAMLPSQKYAGLPPLHQGQISGIFVDQPLSRQAELLHLTLPGRRNIGILISSQNNPDVDVLRALLKRHGATLVAQPVETSGMLFQSLEDLLSRSDILFVLPDSSIYNSNSIRNILLSSYRHREPLIGLSQSYVNAGALYALYSTPSQLATQTADAISRFAKNGKLPNAGFPKYYKIAVNQEVATMLGIPMKSAEQLEQLIEAGERNSNAE